MEGLEDQLRRFKTQLEETTRQNQDLNNLKARLTQENFELQRQVQELDAGNAALSKARSQLQAQLDETKARLDEETRVSRRRLTRRLDCYVSPPYAKQGGWNALPTDPLQFNTVDAFKNLLNHTCCSSF